MNEAFAPLLASIKTLPDAHAWRGAPLAPFTTVGVGGKASLLVTLGSAEAVARTLPLLHSLGEPWGILGGGSNLLVSDRGYPGVVVKPGGQLSYLENFGERGIEVGAALSLPRLARFAAEAGLGGLEFACGIPGTVGGGVAMNAGAHGRSFADVATAAQLALPCGDLEWVPTDRLVWGYRRCALPEGALLTALRLALVPDEPSRLLQCQRDLMRGRRSSQPRGEATFGSVFKNPPGEAAGRLIEAAGLKGLRFGGAQVSTVHANFIVNAGLATCADVLQLIVVMRERVRAETGIELEPEVRLLGGSFPWE